MTNSLPAWRNEYPFASHTLTISGHRWHHLDEGAGQVLLCVHGNPTWSFYWRHLVRELRSEFRVVVPDQLGCGLSDHPAADLRLADRVAHLQEFVTALDLHNVTLIAHDWGGAIGLGCVLAQPQRFSRLVLCNTAAFRSPRMPWRIAACRTPVIGRLAVQGANAFARAALRMATSQPRRFTPAVRAGYLAPYDCWSHRRAVYNFVQDIPMTPSHPSYATLCQIEAGLNGLGILPSMLVWGMNDWCFTPYYLERFQQVWPSAEVHRLTNAGHYVAEDAWEQLVPLVRTFVAHHPRPVDGSTSLAHTAR